jgi:hypothetical protein
MAAKLDVGLILSTSIKTQLQLQQLVQLLNAQTSKDAGEMKIVPTTNVIPLIIGAIYALISNVQAVQLTANVSLQQISVEQQFQQKMAPLEIAPVQLGTSELVDQVL